MSYQVILKALLCMRDAVVITVHLASIQPCFLFVWLLHIFHQNLSNIKLVTQTYKHTRTHT